MTITPKRLSVLVAALILQVPASTAVGQIADPSAYRGSEEAVALATSSANRVEFWMSNHGELVVPGQFTRAIWPRGVGGAHVDGIGLLVAGRVKGEREKWTPWMPEWSGRPDTILTPVAIHYGQVADRRSPSDDPWGWLPLPGFHNPDRVNSTGGREPRIASSDDRSTWPASWPDRIEESDSGWPGRWNGLLGADSLIDGRETYFVMDDLSNERYLVNPDTKVPNSVGGVFYPDPADSSKGGLGLQVGVRTLAFRPLLFEDVVFYHITVSNVGGTPRDSLFVGLYTDLGLGMEQGDEVAGYDAGEHLVWAYDQDGVGQRPDGTLYEVGHVGVTFLGDAPGLTGYDVSSRPFYESADHLLDDAWLWGRIVEAESRIVDGVGESTAYADFEPAILVTSGPYSLAPDQEVSVVAALMFGAGPDARDLYRNLASARALYEASFSVATVVGRASARHHPPHFVLRDNYPNPVNRSTTISYTLPVVSTVTLSLYDMLGRRIRDLVSGTQPPGTHELTLDASNLPSGLYLYRLRTPSHVDTKRMAVLK